MVSGGVASFFPFHPVSDWEIFPEAARPGGNTTEAFDWIWKLQRFSSDGSTEPSLPFCHMKAITGSKSALRSDLYVVYLGERQHDDPELVTASHKEMLSSLLGSTSARKQLYSPLCTITSMDSQGLQPPSPNHKQSVQLVR
ncbi:hypothetical protein AAC387_Pa03g1175 [Persea americana]